MISFSEAYEGKTNEELKDDDSVSVTLGVLEGDIMTLKQYIIKLVLGPELKKDCEESGAKFKNEKRILGFNTNHTDIEKAPQPYMENDGDSTPYLYSILGRYYISSHSTAAW